MEARVVYHDRRPGLVRSQAGALFLHFSTSTQQNESDQPSIRMEERCEYPTWVEEKSMSSPLQIQRATYPGGGVCLALTGPMNAVTVPELQALLSEAQATAPRVVLDLGGVTLLDSSGIAALLRARQEAGRSDHPLILANLSPACNRRLRVTGLIRVFPVYATVAEALGE
jgi:anti-sigma B factor antagonist